MKNYIESALQRAAVALAITAGGCVNDYRDTVNADAQTQSADAGGNPQSDTTTPPEDTGTADHGTTPPPDEGSGEDAGHTYDNDTKLPPNTIPKFPDSKRIDCGPESLKNMNVPTKRNVVVAMQTDGVAAGRIFYSDLAGTEVVTGPLVPKNGNLEYSDEIAFMPDKDKNGGKFLLETMGGGSFDAIAFGGFDMKMFLHNTVTERSKGTEAFEEFMHAEGFVNTYTTTGMTDDWYNPEGGNVMSQTLGDQIGNPEFKNGAFTVKVWEREGGDGKTRVILFQTELPICSPTQAMLETRGTVRRTYIEVTEMPESKLSFVTSFDEIVQV